jgi:hypothetical protein
MTIPTLKKQESVTDVDFAYYVKSAQLFANLQECSSGYWSCVDHTVNIASILLACLTTGEIISGSLFPHWALVASSTALTFVNGFKIYMKPAQKAECHHQCAKIMEQTKLSLGICDNLTEYKHIINNFHTNLSSAPGLVFFLRRHWIGRKERLSVTPNMMQYITTTNRDLEGARLSSQPCLPCCKINSFIDIILHDEEENKQEKEDQKQDDKKQEDKKQEEKQTI